MKTVLVYWEKYYLLTEDFTPDKYNFLSLFKVEKEWRYFNLHRNIKLQKVQKWGALLALACAKKHAIVKKFGSVVE